MRICYLPIFLAISLQVFGCRAEHFKLVRQLDAVSALVGSVLAMVGPSQAAPLFTEITPSSLGKRLETVRGDYGSTFALDNQLKRIQNEVDTLERMVDETPSAVRTSRAKRSEDSDESSDVQGKAMEGVAKGAEMASKGMEGAQNGAQMATDGAQGVKSGAEGLASGADMISKGPEMASAGLGKGKDLASSIPG